MCNEPEAKEPKTLEQILNLPKKDEELGSQEEALLVFGELVTVEEILRSKMSVRTSNS